jgi:hypothetical protein
MHKGVILLTEAFDKNEALDNVHNFLEPYGNGDVWDWYQIGGRWNNTLAPKELIDQFHIKVDNEILIKKEGFPFISQQQVDENQEKLQQAWEELGLKGLNNYCNHYNLPDEGNTYDIVKLSDCVETVKEWLRDIPKALQETWDDMVKAREESKEGKYSMVGYYAGIYKDLDYGNFSFETNVYNIDENEPEKIPKDIEGWWAIMVDMHN